MPPAPLGWYSNIILFNSICNGENQTDKLNSEEIFNKEMIDVLFKWGMRNTENKQINTILFCQAQAKPQLQRSLAWAEPYFQFLPPTHPAAQESLFLG